MKKLIYFTAIFLFFIPLAKSQTTGSGLQNFRALYKATYQGSFQMDSTDTNSKVSGMMFKLFLSDSLSYFVNIERYMRDSIVNEVAKGNISPDVILSNLNTMPRPRADFRVFKNRVSKTITTLNSIFNKDYSYDEPLKIMSWEVHPKVKMFGNLKSQMATGSFAGRDYIAWFTTEIKIADGPYKFNGLPGLIVKIADTRNHLTFELVDFRSTQKLVNVIPLDPVEKTTKQRFKKERERYRANPIIFYEAQGLVFDRETRRLLRERSAERNRRNNNRIELKYD